MYNDFINNYFKYYQTLEEQFISMQKYVEIDQLNMNTYSIEYLKLFQAVCSELDVVAKEIALFFDKTFKTKESSISKWGYVIQENLPEILSTEIGIRDVTSYGAIAPYANWKYQKNRSAKNNKVSISLVPGAKSLDWWNDYNAVKHQRIGLIDKQKNYPKANQWNILKSLAGLFILENSFLKKLEKDERIKDIELHKSSLFI